MPKVAESGLAEFCDVFCERGIFNLEQTKRILDSGQKQRVKAQNSRRPNERLGGAEIAADIGAISADHLNFSSAEGIKAMAEKGVVGSFASSGDLQPDDEASTPMRG